MSQGVFKLGVQLS